MYVLLADATYVFVGLVALAIGFGVCLAWLLVRKILAEGAKCCLRWATPQRKATWRRSQSVDLIARPRSRVS